MFIVAWVMLLVVAFGFPFSTNYSKGFVALFLMFPWTVLGKGIRDLASATTGDSTELFAASLVMSCHAMLLTQTSKEKKKRKTTPLGTVTGASRPTDSLRLRKFKYRINTIRYYVFSLG